MDILLIGVVSLAAITVGTEIIARYSSGRARGVALRCAAAGVLVPLIFILYYALIELLQRLAPGFISSLAGLLLLVEMVRLLLWPAGLLLLGFSGASPSELVPATLVDIAINAIIYAGIGTIAWWVRMLRRRVPMIK